MGARGSALPAVVPKYRGRVRWERQALHEAHSTLQLRDSARLEALLQQPKRVNEFFKSIQLPSYPH